MSKPLTMATLNLDADDIIADNPTGESLLMAAAAPGIENEKCVVPQYRTSSAQRDALAAHIAGHPPSRIPVEWVIDIADETNGWFYGTAYHYNDETQMLHVMVPDKESPTFDGEVLLDYRTVHLIECVDGKSDALFNKIVRDSIVKVKWDVEWFEEDTKDSEEAGKGTWIPSSARYFIRIANQMLVEDDEFAEGTKGFVMVNADVSLRLVRCHKGRGRDDFIRLIQEGVVSSAEGALDDALAAPTAAPAASKPSSAPKADEVASPEGGTAGVRSSVSVRKLLDNVGALRECFEDILDERANTAKKLKEIATQFNNFAVNGDLEAGFKLLSVMQEIAANKGHIKYQVEKDGELIAVDGEAAIDESWYLLGKVEKGMDKLVKAGSGVDAAAVGSPSPADVDQLKRFAKKMKKELEEKEKEIQMLRAKQR